MRFEITCLLLAFMLSACSFQVDVLEPRPTDPITATSPASISIFTPTQTAFTPTLTATSPPLPTFTLTPPPATPVRSDSSSIIPIKFSPNATSQSVSGNIAAGSSQTYSLNAFQGQMMSVSILPDNPELQGTFELEIKGRDGVVLCPIKDQTCHFWRGALPSTQEYLIEVNAQNGGAFDMRVAINPPGTVKQVLNHADPQGRFALSYPDTFAPVHFSGAEFTKIPPDFSLHYIDTQQYTTTNLSEVYFLLGVSDDPQQVSTCTQPESFDRPETILGDTSINGINFTKSEGGGVAAGNIYELVYYRTPHNGSCYEVTYFVHYGNIGAYAPGTVKEFDRTALYQELDEILASLILQ